jgi:hypothetical protein
MGDGGTGTSDAATSVEDDLFKQMMGTGDAGAEATPDAAVDPNDELFKKMME